MRLVSEYTDAAGYFAENQQSLEGLSTNILTALRRAAGIVIVMHKRGLVETPSGERFYRGSVWVEQEIAIAAFLQSIGRKIPVAAYIEADIKREGLRDLIHLNPLSFNTHEEILRDFEGQLKSGRFVPMVQSATAAHQFARPLLAVEASLIGPDESRARNIYPVSNGHQLLLEIANAGTALAKDIEVGLRGSGDNVSITIQPIGPGGLTKKPLPLPRYQFGNPATDTTPAEIVITYSGETSSGGSITLSRTPDSHPPTWLVSSRTDPT